jgi:hypothetical protein
MSNDAIEQRLLQKLLNTPEVLSHMDTSKTGTGVGDIYMFDEDMLDVGKIDQNLLIVDIPPILININLSQLVMNAMFHRKPNIIRMLMKRDINIFNLEPRVMIMCAETINDSQANRREFIPQGETINDSQANRREFIPQGETINDSQANRREFIPQGETINDSPVEPINNPPVEPINNPSVEHLNDPQAKLMYEMIEHKIPVYIEQYRCIYRLAAINQLFLLKTIMSRYNFPNFHEIIQKINIVAIQYGNVNILEYFCPQKSFEGAPDIAFCYFINSIKYGPTDTKKHLPTIKYFISGGVSIKQKNYLAVSVAIEFGKTYLLKYFNELDENVSNILTSEQKEKYGLIELDVVNKYIDTVTSCNILYSDIVEGNRYFKCNNNLHYFHEEAWNQWIENKPNWSCPCCFSPVDKIVYVNKN